MQSRVLNYDMDCESALESSHIYTLELPHGIRAKSRGLARAQVWVRFTTCRWALVRRSLLNKMHSGCDLEYIIVSSDQIDIFSRNGNVAK